MFGGTFGAAVAGSTMSDVRRIGSWLRRAFASERAARNERLVTLLVELASHARKEGMLPLERRARDVADPFLRRGPPRAARPPAVDAAAGRGAPQRGLRPGFLRLSCGSLAAHLR